ncbi:hypothetical protein ACS0TY_010041 [Phlomoides rotata]
MQRLVITRLTDILIEGKVLTGSSSSELALIPRLSLTHSDPILPFKFQMRQFSVDCIICNSFAHVGVFLKKHVLSHGQLYVVVSRISNRSGLKIMLCHGDSIDDNKQRM